MPRQARLDSPGTLHHVIVRGIEKRRIVDDLRDRQEFVSHMGETASSTGTIIYAWSLMTNHAHILLRSGPAGLATFMRRFLTRYAIRYNRRHRRHGHLFQNRYKSIVCEEDGYFRELVRYIHLNPLRTKLVEGISQLGRYRWCGHSVILGQRRHDWQDRRHVLSWFGSREAEAVRAYQEYMEEGIALGRRPELVGGGLIRSLGGWSEVRSMRRRRERVRTDERILGRGEFVERVMAEAEARIPLEVPLEKRLREARSHIDVICNREGISVEELSQGSRRRGVSQLRLQIARHLVFRLGLSLAEAARLLGISTSGICKALEPGRCTG